MEGPERQKDVPVRGRTLLRARTKCLLLRAKRLAGERKQKVRREAEKHLLGHVAVEMLLDGAAAEGVHKVRTPSGNTISRKL